MLDLSLYLVTDSVLCGDRSLEQIVAAAVRGGCTIVQLREKHLETGAFISRARKIKEVLGNIPLIINDRVDVAMAVDADGVHLGHSDMSAMDARRLLGEKAIIGLSIEHVDEIEEANRLPVDYVAVSPVFATSTKTDTAEALGLEGCKQIVLRSTHPVIGIGGLNRKTVAAAMATGLKGVAVVSEIMKAADPEQVARELAILIQNVQCTIHNENV